MRQFSSLLWPLSSNYAYLYLLLVEVCFWMLLPLGYHDSFPSAWSLFLVSYEMVSVLPLYTLPKLLIGKSHAPPIYLSLELSCVCMAQCPGCKEDAKLRAPPGEHFKRSQATRVQTLPYGFSRCEGRASYSIDKKNQTLDNVPGMWRSDINLPGSQSAGFKLLSLKQIYGSSM
jgi:hypothetical protein